MACIEMFNTEQHQTFGTPMSPRISFSNDFIDTQQAMKHEQQQRNSSRSDGVLMANVSSNFEFSVSSYSMSAADEIFSKGRLLPFKDNCSNNNNNNQFQKMTLRDELLVDDDEDDFTLSPTTSRPPKGPIRWKEILGLKSRTHNVSTKVEHNKSINIVNDHGSVERVVEGNESMVIHEEENETSKISEELLSDGKSSCRDVGLLRDGKSSCKDVIKAKWLNDEGHV